MRIAKSIKQNTSKFYQSFYFPFVHRKKYKYLNKKNMCLINKQIFDLCFLTKLQKWHAVNGLSSV